MTPAELVDLQADRLIAATVAITGDLKTALAVLCTAVSPADINGERYEAALRRAFQELFGVARTDFPPD